MHTLTLAPVTAGTTVIRCRPARVYVNGQRKRHLEVLSWDVLPAPSFGRVRLVAAPSRLSASAGRVEEFGSLPAIGAQILIRPAPGSGGGEFQGIVAAHRAETAENGETLIAEADHLLTALLAAKLRGRWQLAGETPGNCGSWLAPMKFSG